MAAYTTSRNLVRLTTKICSLQASLRLHRTFPILTTSTSQQARSLCRSSEWKNPHKDRQQVQQTEAINCEEDPYKVAVEKCILCKYQVPISYKAINCEEDPYKVAVEKCILCKYQVPISYKNVQLLSQFVSPNTGRIFGRHITKLCEAQQRRVTKAVKRAITMGFMPSQYRTIQFLKDPSLYDIRYTGSTAIGQYSKLPDSNISEEELLEMQQRAEEEAKKTQS